MNTLVQVFGTRDARFLDLGYSPKDGRALSFALRLRNKNSGANHTQIAKNAATSMNTGPSSFFPLEPYRYLAPRYRLAS